MQPRTCGVDGDEWGGRAAIAEAGSDEHAAVGVSARAHESHLVRSSGGMRRGWEGHVAEISMREGTRSTAVVMPCCLLTSKPTVGGGGGGVRGCAGGARRGGWTRDDEDGEEEEGGHGDHEQLQLPLQRRRWATTHVWMAACGKWPHSRRFLMATQRAASSSDQLTLGCKQQAISTHGGPRRACSTHTRTRGVCCVQQQTCRRRVIAGKRNLKEGEGHLLNRTAV